MLPSTKFFSLVFFPKQNSGVHRAGPWQKYEKISTLLNHVLKSPVEYLELKMFLNHYHPPELEIFNFSNYCRYFSCFSIRSIRCYLVQNFFPLYFFLSKIPSPVHRVMCTVHDKNMQNFRPFRIMFWRAMLNILS